MGNVRIMPARFVALLHNGREVEDGPDYKRGGWPVVNGKITVKCTQTLWIHGAVVYINISGKKYIVLDSGFASVLHPGDTLQINVQKWNFV